MTYALITGLTYAGFSAVVLEAIGLGAAATKYNVFASLSNMPIAYMTVIEGWAQTRWNVSGMLFDGGIARRGGLGWCSSRPRQRWQGAGWQRADARQRDQAGSRATSIHVPFACDATHASMNAIVCAPSSMRG